MEEKRGHTWLILSTEISSTLIASEAIEDYRVRKKGVVFKSNFEKAYDHVDWNILDKELAKAGFGYRWRWMWGCLRNMSFPSSLTGVWGVKWWPREALDRETLSPFLFLLVVDALSRIVRRWIWTFVPSLICWWHNVLILVLRSCSNYWIIFEPFLKICLGLESTRANVVLWGMMMRSLGGGLCWRGDDISRLSSSYLGLQNRALLA